MDEGGGGKQQRDGERRAREGRRVAVERGWWWLWREVLFKLRSAMIGVIYVCHVYQTGPNNASRAARVRD